MRQVKQCRSLLASSPLQPPHGFFARRWAIQQPQFIPQGAIILELNDSGDNFFAIFISKTPPGRIPFSENKRTRRVGRD
jgi:hypothetical protein